MNVRRELGSGPAAADLTGDCNLYAARGGAGIFFPLS